MQKFKKTILITLLLAILAFGSAVQAQNTPLSEEEKTSFLAQIEMLKNILASLKLQAAAGSATQSNQPCSQIEVNWSPVDNADYYKLYRNGVQIYEGEDTNFIDTNLVKGKNYGYSIRAGNSMGESGLSNTKYYLAKDPCPPSKPVILSATTGSCGGKINISWTPASRAFGYELLRGSKVVYEGVSTNFTDSDLKPDKNYKYKVRALGQAESFTESEKIDSEDASNICPPSSPDFENPIYFNEAGYPSVSLLSYPSNSNSFDQGKENETLMRFYIEALDSDITVQTIDISFNKKPWQYFENITVRSGFTKIIDIEPSSSDFNEVSNDNYKLRISGLNINIKEGRKKTFTVKVDVDSSVPGGAPQEMQIFLDDRAVRAKDLANVVEFAPLSGGGENSEFSRTFTIEE